ncbi:MAG: hypothetical protein JOY58_10240 [Solirubrobacterales bacterium]|nr:hypothetical protein [Solirubrobacterales bacterium]
MDTKSSLVVHPAVPAVRDVTHVVGPRALVVLAHIAAARGDGGPIP